MPGQCLITRMHEFKCINAEHADCREVFIIFVVVADFCYRNAIIILTQIIFNNFLNIFISILNLEYAIHQKIDDNMTC